MRFSTTTRPEPLHPPCIPKRSLVRLITFLTRRCVETINTPIACRKFFFFFGWSPEVVYTDHHHSLMIKPVVILICVYSFQLKLSLNYKIIPVTNFFFFEWFEQVNFVVASIVMICNNYCFNTIALHTIALIQPTKILQNPNTVVKMLTLSCS